MKMSEGVEWGLHCLVVLATLPPKATIPAKALAIYHGVSETYLIKHLQALAGRRLIESQPGPKGGYRLMQTPEKITLLDVVRAIEGPDPAFRCVGIRQRGPLASDKPGAYSVPCLIHVAMARAERAWQDALRSQTLADIMQEYSGSLSPQRKQQISEWLTQHIRQAPDPNS